MTKVRKASPKPSEEMELLNHFYLGVASLDTLEEVSHFVKDLLTAQELAMLARRLRVAQLLIQGETYEEISRQLHIGKDTIARVHLWVDAGRGGYRNAVGKIQRHSRRKERWAAWKARELEMFSLPWLKRRYPAEYGLIGPNGLRDMLEDLHAYLGKVRRRRSVRIFLRGKGKVHNAGGNLKA